MEDAEYGMVDARTRHIAGERHKRLSGDPSSDRPQRTNGSRVASALYDAPPPSRPQNGQEKEWDWWKWEQNPIRENRDISGIGNGWDADPYSSGRTQGRDPRKSQDHASVWWWLNGAILMGVVYLAFGLFSMMI